MIPSETQRIKWKSFLEEDILIINFKEFIIIFSGNKSSVCHKQTNKHIMKQITESTVEIKFRQHLNIYYKRNKNIIKLSGIYGLVDIY